MRDKYFIIDICGTLFRSNTTFDFVRYYYGDRWTTRILFSFPFRVLNRMLDKMLGYEPMRQGLIRMLRGQSRQGLRQMAEQFYDQFLLPRENKMVTELVQQKREQGYIPVILSATIDPIAEAVASRLEIEQTYSSLLSYSEEGICRGVLQTDLLRSKRTELEAHGIRPPYAGIVTDNYSDGELIEQSGEPYLVNYKCEEAWTHVLSKDTIKRCRIISI